MSPQSLQKAKEVATSGNYRPMSLSSVKDKLLESIIREKIAIYLEHHSLIRESKDGFKNKISHLG